MIMASVPVRFVLFALLAVMMCFAGGCVAEGDTVRRWRVLCNGNNPMYSDEISRGLYYCVDNRHGKPVCDHMKELCRKNVILGSEHKKDNDGLPPREPLWVTVKLGPEGKYTLEDGAADTHKKPTETIHQVGQATETDFALQEWEVFCYDSDPMYSAGFSKSLEQCNESKHGNQLCDHMKKYCEKHPNTMEEEEDDEEEDKEGNKKLPPEESFKVTVKVEKGPKYTLVDSTTDTHKGKETAENIPPVIEATKRVDGEREWTVFCYNSNPMYSDGISRALYYCVDSRHEQQLCDHMKELCRKNVIVDGKHNKDYNALPPDESFKVRVKVGPNKKYTLVSQSAETQKDSGITQTIPTQTVVKNLADTHNKLAEKTHRVGQTTETEFLQKWDVVCDGPVPLYSFGLGKLYLHCNESRHGKQFCDDMKDLCKNNTWPVDDEEDDENLPPEASFKVTVKVEKGPKYTLVDSTPDTHKGSEIAEGIHRGEQAISSVSVNTLHANTHSNVSFEGDAPEGEETNTPNDVALGVDTGAKDMKSQEEGLMSSNATSALFQTPYSGGGVSFSSESSDTLLWVRGPLALVLVSLAYLTVC